VDYGVKSSRVAHKGEETLVKINIFDLSGDSDYFEVRNEFYNNVGSVLLVYDVSMKESFQYLDNWLAEARRYGMTPQTVPFLLCANKVDKLPRQVTEKVGLEYATTHKMKYIETSARSGSNIRELFNDACVMALEWLSQGK